MSDKFARTLISVCANNSWSRAVLACLFCLSFPGLAVARNARVLQAPARAGEASQSGADSRTLEFGKPAERDLKSGDLHAYQVNLKADQYIELAVEQRGINVVVSVFDPG